MARGAHRRGENCPPRVAGIVFSALHLIEAHRHLAESSLALGENKEAKEHVLKMLHHCRGIAQNDRNGTPSAWAPGRAACVIATYSAAGRLLALLGEHEFIVEQLQELAGQADDGTRFARLTLAECLLRAIGQGPEVQQSSPLLTSALAEASRCLESCKPEEMSPHECNAIAWLLAVTDVDSLRDVSRSLEFARSAVEHQGDNRSYLQTLAVACYYVDQWHDARNHLLRCLELDAPQPDDLFFLAMTSYQQGHKEEARKWYDTAVSEVGRNEENGPALTRFRREAEELLGIKGSRRDG